jgi:hypothetical protein
VNPKKKSERAGLLMICWSTAALAQVVDPQVTQSNILPIYGYLNRVQSRRRPEREAWRNS